MKNQTDLIVIIVAGVFTLGAGLGMWLMKRDPVALTAPTPVTTTAAPLPAGDVTFANSLPGGGGSSGLAGARGGGGGPMGGMMGMGGPMSAGAGGGGLGTPGINKGRKN